MFASYDEATVNSSTETRNNAVPESNDTPESPGAVNEPEGKLTPAEWFVGQMASDLGPRDRPVDIRCRRILLRLSSWATSEGLPLEREVVLDPDTVERFCQRGVANDRSRATFRSDLRRMGPLLTRSAPWQPRPQAIATRNLAPPYTFSEIELLRADAANQPTEARRRGARALLALGLGAGLDGRWVARVYDLPGLQLYGDSEEDALTAARTVTEMLLPESNPEHHRILAFHPDRSPDSARVPEYLIAREDIASTVDIEEIILQ